MEKWVIQGIGLVGMALAIIAYQCRERKRLLVVQILSTLAFTLHFGLLGAYTGAMMNLMTAARQLLFLGRDKKWCDHRYVPILVALCFLVSGILTWEAWYSFLPIFGGCAATFASWRRRPFEIRLIMGTCSSPPWLIYNCLCGSVAGILTEALALISIAVAFFRIDLPDLRRARAGKYTESINSGSAASAAAKEPEQRV